VQIPGNGVVGHGQIKPAVVILIHQYRGQAVIMLRVGDASFSTDIGECAIAIVVKQMIAFPRQTARAAHGETHAAILACAQADSTLPSDRRMVGIELHVTWHKQIQQAIPIIVAPSWPCGPTTKSDAGFLRHISKRSIVIVVIEAVLSVICNVDVRPAIIIVIAYSHAESPSLIRHASFRSFIGEGAVMIVVQQHSAGSWLLPFQGSKRGAVEQIDVQPAVVVIIKQSYTRTRGLEDSRLFWS